MVQKGKGMKNSTLNIKEVNWRGENYKLALQAWNERQGQYRPT